MGTQVADRSSNKNEQIVHAAEVIGRSKHRYDVFEAIYTGKTKTKSILALMKVLPRMQRTRILDAGKALADNDLVAQTKDRSLTAYTKVEFMQRYRDKILAAAKNKEKREAIPTKRTVARGSTIVTLKIPKTRNLAIPITVDDVGSFAAVKKVPDGLEYVKIAERKFKDGVAKILGEKGSFQDWGGESRDLSSTRVRIGGKRHRAAFAFKGPGKSGRLTPGKMGKHGDQIQRLARCPADVFFVQYWAEVDDSVMDQLEQLMRAKSYLESRKVWYGVIDGQDSARLIQAYANQFK
ncbi:MAG TPA: hypothetical protein VMF91_17510 [Bryobacteraceae bacterium]|nr:hypothetical protein [Bryobacteraceae bacterium]